MTGLRFASLTLAAVIAVAAPASAGLIGDAVVIKRVQGGNTIFKTVSTTVGAGLEYDDNFFRVDITDNEVVLDAIANFSIGDIVYTIEGLDFDDVPGTPNIITGFSSTQIFGNATPFDARRATIDADGKFTLSVVQTTGSSSGLARITLGAPAQAPVPEPAMWAMLIGGFGMIGAAARRTKATVTYA